MPGKYSPVWLVLPAVYAGAFFILFSDLLAFVVFIASVVIGFSVTMIERVVIRTGTVRSYSDASDELVTESILFQLAMIPLALFVLTSTQAVMGQGVVLGIVLWQAVRAWFVRQEVIGSGVAERISESTSRAVAWTVACGVATLFVLFL